MRWTMKDRQQGVRIVNRFLLFPVKIGKEIRWLERAKILQHQNGIEGFWTNVEFVKT